MLKKIEEYISLRILLLKVEGTERLSEALAVLFRRIILLMFIFSVIFFASVALALWIGNIINSYVIGFLILAGVHLLILIILYIFRKQLLEKNIKDEVVHTVFKEKQEKQK